MIKWFYLFMYSIILLFSNQSPDEFGHRNLSSLKLQILISWYQLQCIVPETGRKGKLVILRSNKERREGIIPVQWKPKSVISELWYWGDVGIQQHLIGSSSWCQSRSCWWWCNADFLFLLLTNDQGSTDAWSPSRHHGPSLRVRQHKHGEIFCRSSLLPKITKNVINHWTRDSIFDFNHPNQSS